MTKHVSQWTLGQLIDALDKAKPNKIWHAYAGFYLSGIRSYRGYYEDLAIGLSQDYVADDAVAFLRFLRDDTIGATFHGYKGGDYIATRETPLWIANWGNCGDTIVSGLHLDGDVAHLLGTWIGGL